MAVLRGRGQWGGAVLERRPASTRRQASRETDGEGKIEKQTGKRQTDREKGETEKQTWKERQTGKDLAKDRWGEKRTEPEGGRRVRGGSEQSPQPSPGPPPTTTQACHRGPQAHPTLLTFHALECLHQTLGLRLDQLLAFSLPHAQVPQGQHGTSPQLPPPLPIGKENPYAEG